MIFNRLFYEFNVVNSRFIVIEIHRMRSSLKRNYVSIFDNINNELASSNILPVLDIFRQAIFGDSTANRTIFKISNMLQNKFIWLFKGNWLWLTYFCTDIFVNANTWGAGLDWKRCELGNAVSVFSTTVADIVCRGLSSTLLCVGMKETLKRRMSRTE